MNSYKWPWWTTRHFLSTQHNMHSALKPSVSASACPGIPRRSAAASPVACSALSNSPHHHQADQRAPQEQQRCTDRRGVLLAGSAAVLLAAWTPAEAQAGFQKELKKRKLTDADFVPSEDVGLRISELSQGNSGPTIKNGDRVVVHFDVLYRGVDVVSSRSARLLGGNRTIAEPYEFIVGQPTNGQPLKKISDSAGGLFSGMGGPKPPAALSKATIGMKKGGRRMILVDDPALGYGATGIQELPPNTTFELRVEVLEVYPA